MSRIEHVNITVTNPEQTAQMLCQVFGWQVRWSGPSQLGGRTVHVGGEHDYLAVYTFDGQPGDAIAAGRTRSGLNHVGIEVEDLDTTEQKVIEAGYKPFNHGDYEPGRRFYFVDADEVEYEVVSYL